MLIKKQADDSPSEKKITQGGQHTAALLGTYSDEISCNPHQTHAWQVGQAEFLTSWNMRSLSQETAGS